MTLTYATEINGKPTNFVDKIWQCLLRDGVETGLMEFTAKLKEVLPIIGGTKIGDYPPKKHSIRQDLKNRWKPGSKIHNKIWTGRPYHSPTFQFTPVLDCVSTQSIEIVLKDGDGCKLQVGTVYIDNVWLPGVELDQLALNDGFDSSVEFIEYFTNNWTRNYKGKIIHWTDYKY